VEDESPWVGPGPQGFCRVFGPVGFFGPSPHGPGPNPMGWAKSTPLRIVLIRNLTCQKTIYSFICWVYASKILADIFKTCGYPCISDTRKYLKNIYFINFLI